MVTTLARSERSALADLFLELGPDAPTLCGDWTTRDLAAHLALRERRPDAAVGIVLGAAAGRTASVQAGYAARPYADLVGLVRSGPGWLSPFALPGIDTLLNTTEYVVHHEDVRRATAGWSPRLLPAGAQDNLWKVVSTRARMSFRGLDCGVRLWRSDRPAATPVAIGPDSPTANLTGEPLELLLYCFGRGEHALVEVTGDPAAIEVLQVHPLAV